MNKSFDEAFCIYLEYHIGSVFENSSDTMINHFWCDGVAMPSPEQLDKKYINDKRRITTKAWIGVNGQREYEITIKFGKYSLRRIAKGKSLKDCVPDYLSSDWIKIDIKKATIELQFL